MLKAAYIMGAHKAFVEKGLLSPNVPISKIAQAADIAAQATPEEAQTIGNYIGPQDLDSLSKILEILSSLLQNYQQQGMPPQGMPQDQMQQGMPPQGMPPQGMPPQGGMPQQGMPPQGGMPQM